MSDLDEFQKKAVYAKEGPVMVCAGPGSGKTKTLVHRILQLIQNGVDTCSILAVTFTNKAALEMKQRLEKQLSESRKCNSVLPFIGTIHSLCLEILQTEKREQFTLLDEYDKLEISQVLKSKHKLKFRTKEVLTVFDHYKCGKVKKLPAEAARIYSYYQKYLKENALLDFDDLLLEVLDLFKNKKKVRDKYQKKFKYILVDEYQDINKVQDDIIRILSKPQDNLFVIGDVDQSIYAFRGADPDIFMKFRTDFEDAQMVTLKTNYRSTPSVVKASLSLIQNNKNRLPMNLSSIKKKDCPVNVIRCGREKDEAKFIVSEIEKVIGGTTLLHMDSEIESPDSFKEEYLFSDFAILYRKNSFAKYFEHELSHKGMPYQVIGLNNFWQLEEIRSVMRLLRALVTGEEILVEDLLRQGVNLSRYRQVKIENISKIIERSGIKHLYKDDTEACANIAGLIDIINETEFTTVEELLSKLALLSRETFVDQRANYVKLLTLHQAKGLEFKTVFIAGCEEGTIPLIRDEISQKELEEERRLFYVGMTRAKERLYLTYAQNRMIWGRRMKQRPSIFLGEIDERYFTTREFIKRRKKKDQMRLF